MTKKNTAPNAADAMQSAITEGRYTMRRREHTPGALANVVDIYRDGDHLLLSVANIEDALRYGFTAEQFVAVATMTDAEHTEHLIRKHDATVKHRARMEVSIIRRTIRALTAAGYDLSVDDGGEPDEIVRGDERALIEAVMSVEEARLYADREDEEGWVFFVMGNDGHDVIADYTVNLENELADVNAYADRLADGGALEDGGTAKKSGHLSIFDIVNSGANHPGSSADVGTAAGHTPGPWEVSKHGTPDYAPQFGIYAEGRQNDLATVKGDSAEANARLIAAAPELLAELHSSVKMMVNALDNMARLFPAKTPEAQAWRKMLQAKVTEARAAIAKAGGAL